MHKKLKKKVNDPDEIDLEWLPYATVVMNTTWSMFQLSMNIMFIRLMYVLNILSKTLRKCPKENRRNAL